MERFFVGAYDYFNKHPRILVIVFILTVGVAALLASQIKISENVSEIFPDDEKASTFNQVFQSRALEKLAFMVSAADSSQADPDQLIVYADSLVAKIGSRAGQYIERINFRIDEERALEFYQIITEHLPIFLTEEDYVKLDSLLVPSILKQRVNENYHQLISPSGIFAKRLYSKDIIGISQLGVGKLHQLQYDENYVLYDNCLFTKDFSRLIFFVVPKFPSSNTGQNIPFIKELNEIVRDHNAASTGFRAGYFGGTAVAVGNAIQLREDTLLTASMTVLLLVAFVIWFFRKKSAPVLVLVPVFFGGLFSLACLAIIKGDVSVIALAAGSIVLGIAVNYSLHFMVHLQHTQNKRETIKDLVSPLTLGSATTVLAFFGLRFANAAILRDIGLFAGFSLVGAALCSLLFLPHFFKDGAYNANHKAENYLSRFLALSSSKNRALSIVILLLTPLFFYFAGGARFNSDMNKLNFMSTELIRAQTEFYSINEVSLQSVYLVARGKDEQQALRQNEKNQGLIAGWKQQGIAKNYLSPSLLLISDSLQAARIYKWNSYWTQEKKNQILQLLRAQGDQLKFSETVYNGFRNFIDRKYLPTSDSTMTKIQNAFFSESILNARDQTLVITPVKVNRGQKEKLYDQLSQSASLTAIDRQTLTNDFIGRVNDDFTFIVTFTSVLVFVALLLAYRNIELTLITFLPMFITWVWILGIMALLRIEFNLINVMVSTFIFGLGDDYSIFTMDGLRHQERGKETLSSVRTSIFVSAITTIIGLGVLIFAKHPALQSIAWISITGIVCVFVMSQTLEPFLFNWLFTSRTKRGLPPMTLRGMLQTFASYFCFVTGSFVLAVLGFILLKLIPFQRSKLRYFYHVLLGSFTRTLVNSTFCLDKRILNAEGVFEKPSIIICNHSSFLDILVTIMLTPKVILLTNKWVWRSPIFGLVVQLAEYYPVDEGAEGAIEKLQKKIEEGYSIVIFPEGTRSPDGELQRFHKGAFYLAEKLQIAIRPLLIYGTHVAIPKADFYINDSLIVLKFLPAILPDDHNFGSTYQERTKLISKYFKNELEALSREIDNRNPQ